LRSWPYLRGRGGRAFYRGAPHDLGISINDTIVVFDRIRENLRLNEEHHKRESYDETVGRSIMQTLARSINTSLTVVIVLAALYFVGPASTKDFAFTLIVGMIAGTYSSIFLASPLLVVWERFSYNNQMIIGITGTIGAGKGTVVEYLKSKGFKHYSARDVWNEEIARRGLVSNRDTMTAIANELRAEHGPGYFSKRALEKIAEQGGGDGVIESIRSIGEAEYLKSHGAQLWAVDADVHARYERITERQSETDKVSFEKFQADEKREWENPDPHKQNLKAVIAMADVVFTNNGTQDELFLQVEAALQKISK
jgi:dephospho-CoA kinase